MARMDCKEARQRIHEYLDGELNGREAEQLACHIRQCEECARHLRTLEKTEALVGSLRRFPCPDEVTERVMSSIPAPRRRTALFRWVKKYPGASVAALFLCVMFASMMATWDPDDTLVVKTNDLDRLIVNGKQVIVPAGTTVDGDLIVENGHLQIEGEVRGNVIVMDGTLSASTAQITGKVKHINQAIDWLLYKVEDLVTSVSP